MDEGPQSPGKRMQTGMDRRWSLTAVFGALVVLLSVLILQRPPLSRTARFYGGSGGRPQIAGCGEGAGLVGVDVTVRGPVAGLRARCRRSGDGDPVSPPEGDAFGAGRVGRFRSTRAESLHCPAGEWVVGMHGRADRYVRKLGLSCARPGALEDSRHRIPPVGQDQGEPFRALCPEGEIADQLRVHAGALVDAVSLGCR